MKSKELGTPDPTGPIKTLRNRIDRTKGKAASRRNLAIFRQTVADTPGAMPEEWRAATSAMVSLIDEVAKGGSRACLLADLDMARREFEYESAPALERVVIDSILAARLRLAVVEHAYASKGFDTRTADYWETLLTNAQNRLLRAAESLARIRRLARNTPSIQLNLAGNGGQQVNSIG